MVNTDINWRYDGSGYNRLEPPTTAVISSISTVSLLTGAVELGTKYDPLHKALSSLDPPPQTTLDHRVVVPDYMALSNNMFSGFLDIMLSPTAKLPAGTPVSVHIDFELSATTKILESTVSLNIDKLLANPKKCFDVSANSLYATTETWYYVGELKELPADTNVPVIKLVWDTTHKSAPFSTAADGANADVSVTITSFASNETLVLAST